MIKQTAGRDQLGEFAPKFAQLNDDVLFGEVWNREGLSLKLRSILTVTILVSKGLVDSSFQYHMENARKNGVTRDEMAEILTHAAFYAGWPNAWAAFRVAAEVYRDDPGVSGGIFGLGQPNNSYARYFTGKSYLNPLTNPEETIFLANVTFEPGCRNHWHIHHAAKGGGQILLCTDGRGWYQAWGGEARELRPGDAVHIPAGVKHWHGAAKDSWFSHIAFEAPGEDCSTEWCEPVDAGQYAALR
ncbi:MAG: cupin domain-containing protein [Oscillibacter sp.]|jgi:4-carboxymuconolactone decarboxylase|nr:cupin domain-containing protein [Oscillibacter sp.]